MSASRSLIFQRAAPRLRSLYRRFLRELPTHSPVALLQSSPLQQRIRHQISTPHVHPTPSTPAPSIPSSAASPSLSYGAPTDSSDEPVNEAKLDRELAAADQYVQYLRAQRVHTTLLERYNPGMNMSEEDRVRLTARRVGMDLPVEMQRVLDKMNIRNDEGGGGQGESGDGGERT